MAISELHAAARRLAAKGVAVFPCVQGGKAPATERGFHDATTDQEQIDAWWGQNPQFNLAFSPAHAGLAIIDPDGVAGLAAWADLQNLHGAISSYEVATPRGGRHVYFRGELPPTVAKLAPHVDTRGRGSYALLPPSRLEGYERPYQALNATAPAPLPDWLKDHPAFKPRDKVAATTDDLDLPANVTRASKLLTDYVQRGNVAKLGEAGDAKTYQVACEVMNLGLSPDKTFEIMWEIWAPHCEPFEPDRFHDFLERKVSNAASYAQNEAGAWAVEPTQQVFGAALDKLSAEDAPARPSRFRAWELEELAALPPPSWLVPEMIPDKGLSLFYGPGDSYKTFLVIDIGLTLAKAGKTVLYLAGEGGVGAYQRIAAWKLAHDVERLREFKVVREMPWASDGEMLTEFLEENRKHRPDLIIVDTAARMMFGLNENDARDMGTLVMALDTIKRQFDCAVVAIHHTGKDVTKGARGSDALLYATDAAFEVQADVKVNAAAIHCRRQKDAKRRETPWTFEGREVAGSLVFHPIPVSEYKRLTTADDEITPKKVGAVLVRLGARGMDRAVTTHILALEMVENGLSDEQKAEAVSRLSGLLSRRASGVLEPYATGKGAGLKWFLP